MQQHTEAGEYVNPNLGLSLIAAIARDPNLYWQVLDYLPEDHPAALVRHSGNWRALDYSSWRWRVFPLHRLVLARYHRLPPAFLSSQLKLQVQVFLGELGRACAPGSASSRSQSSPPFT